MIRHSWSLLDAAPSSAVPAVRRIVPGGVDAALELVGTPTLRDTLHATRIHGVACFTGMLSNQWTIPDFYPIDYIPRGVRLTSYIGGAAVLPGSVLQEFLQAVSDGTATVPTGKVYALDDIVQAHTDMEENRVSGNSSTPPKTHHLIATAESFGHRTTAKSRCGCPGPGSCPRSASGRRFEGQRIQRPGQPEPGPRRCTCGPHR